MIEVKENHDLKCTFVNHGYQWLSDPYPADIQPLKSNLNYGIQNRKRHDGRSKSACR